MISSCHFEKVSILRRRLILQTKEIASTGVLVKSRKKKEYLHLPDLQFFKWCNQQYGVNKGVYNTIDDWLYHFGISDILSRRIQLLEFLEFAKSTGIDEGKHKFIRFGNGGLVRKLHDFTKIHNGAIDYLNKDDRSID